VGYNSVQTKDVKLYGIAEVTGDYYCDEKTDWWLFKRKAEIWKIDRKFPVEIFRNSFGGSLIGALNGPFTKDQFTQFINGLHEYDRRVFRGLGQPTFLDFLGLV